jgi:hypothetical protein
MQILEVRALALAQHVLAIRHLDLDDVGSPVSELSGAGRPRAHARQVDYAEMGEGVHKSKDEGGRMKDEGMRAGDE